jgi:EAL domain-containing protein (putative c-di-GMP-specific phosphodiesterase class I)
MAQGFLFSRPLPFEQIIGLPDIFADIAVAGGRG